MDALGFGIRAHTSHLLFFSLQSRNLFKTLSCSLKFATPIHGLRAVRMQADSEDFELKQAKDMAAARKRWEALVREGKVKPLTPKEAGYAVQLYNTTLLDVRPATEHQKAWVKG